MSSRLAVALVSCLSLIALAGCGSSGDSNDQAASTGSTSVPTASGRLVEDGTFTLSLAFDPGSLDVIGNGGIERQLPLFLYDGLVATVNGKDIKPNLATEWEIKPREIVFTIHDGVTCSDDSPVTPTTIAKAFREYQTPRAQIRPFGDVSNWTVKGDDEAGTVTFSFKKPVGFPLQAVADVPVVCGKGLENPKILKSESSGTGPYVLTKAVPGDRYTLTRRDGYTWGPDGANTDEPGLPKTVVMRVVADPSTATNLFLSGDLDESAMPLSAGDRLRGRGRMIPVGRDVGQLLFNNDKSRPTGDPAVRRALTMAVDREALASVARGELLNSLTVPYTSPCTDSSAAEVIPAHDPEGAARLLDEAGWTKGSDGVRVKDGKRLELKSFLFNDMASELRAAAELVARTWRELGVDIKNRTVTGTAGFQTISGNDWDVFPMTAVTEVNPAALSGLFLSPPPPDGANYPRIDNPAYTEAAKEALANTSDEEACADWAVAERALYESADIVPVVVSNRLYAMQENIDLAVTIFGVVPTSVRIHEE
jgi:peptide/nickel transport system substrate-binding protein